MHGRTTCSVNRGVGKIEVWIIEVGQYIWLQGVALVGLAIVGLKTSRIIHSVKPGDIFNFSV